MGCIYGTKCRYIFAHNDVIMAKNNNSQDQIYDLIFQDRSDVDWRTLIYELVRTENLDLKFRFSVKNGKVFRLDIAIVCYI